MNTPRSTTLVQVFLFFQRWVSILVRLENVVRDEVLCAWVSPEKRSEVNRYIYSKNHHYLPGGFYFNCGLFDWEREAVSGPHFPKEGRIFLGAAGGGRELNSLLELGFTVLAIEPCERLADQARKIAEPFGSSVKTASYEDLITAVERKTGPLACKELERPFDAVVLGWGSLSYLLQLTDRQALLRCARILCPKGPILMSYLSTPLNPIGKIERLRPYLRKFFSWMGAPATVNENDAFVPGGGFQHLFAPEEIQNLAEHADYETVFGTVSPYPHVILKPKKTAVAYSEAEGFASSVDAVSV